MPFLPHARDGAIAALQTAPYASTEYATISGVRKGTVLSRNPDGVAHAQALGGAGGNQCPKRLAIFTRTTRTTRAKRQ